MVIRSTAVPGKRDELFELYRAHLAPRAEANERQQFVMWCADQHDPDGFVLFEVYRDAEALGANAGADWFASYMERALPLLATEPIVTMLEPKWSKGL